MLRPGPAAGSTFGLSAVAGAPRLRPVVVSDQDLAACPQPPLASLLPELVPAWAAPPVPA